ncbi:MAG: organic solvent tolerance protein OstA [Bacteroidetes bacterium]|nr:MAG: organic solvent tolerance protein OstA [Bacteroidota bacterium]
MKYIITYLTILCSFLSFAQTSTPVGQTKIEILSADQLTYNQERGRFQICRGNVRFKQGTMFMNCDSAYFYEEVNRIEAFGKIHIRQKDTLDLWGGYLEYDGDLRQAKVSKNVKLTDGEMVLTTDQLNYDMVNKVGYYSSGGNIVNNEDKLYSRKGTYYTRSKEFYFKDSVRLTNPEYTMESDTLSYNTFTKVATFYGPTYIRSEENTIYCQSGWYNTDKEVSQFSNRAYIEGKENRLEADSMVYYRETGFGEAFGNLKLVDTTEEITITGQYGKYNRISKKTLITGNPIAIKNMDGDSFYLSADTLINFADTALNQKRRLNAFHDVNVYMSEMQAVADSMVYNLSDSTIGFYTNPVLWTDSNQITGDTIIVFRSSEGLRKLEAFNNGFIVERDRNGFYNQIKGKRLDAYFVASKLKRVDVDGNGQSIYYALEDSTQYAGVNDVVCGKMVIRIDVLNKVRTINFKNKPKAIFYPLEKFPNSKAKLSGFEWKNSIRPKKAYF